MVKLIAHRGASFEVPENSLSSFHRAIELRADAIEIDVHLSKDLVPIVIHDDSLERTTDAPNEQFVEMLSLKEIQSYKIRQTQETEGRVERVPTLKDILAIDRQGIGLMIEIKKSSFGPSLIVSSILKETRDCKDSGPLIFGSFEIAILQEVKKQSPEATLIGIVEEQAKLAPFIQMQVPILAIWHPLLNKPLIETLHENRISIFTFTVDDLEKAAFLKALGVEAIITNQPRQLAVIR